MEPNSSLSFATLSQTSQIVSPSGLAPMLGAVPVAFAMLASSSYAEGTRVLVNAEGSQAAATVGSLRFLDAPERDGGAS